MKYVIIYGSTRKGSTYNCVQLLLNKLRAFSGAETAEFWLPRDMPEHCRGCFNCLLQGEENCPHFSSISPLIGAMLEADGIILASPVYGLDVSGAMKTLIDHTCYLWMSHRPREEMFTKVGFVLSTAAGTGTRRSNKTMKNTLSYLGVKRIYSFGSSVAASSWTDVKPEKKVKIERQLTRKAEKFYRACQARKKLRYRLHTRLFYLMMRKLIRGYQEESLDKQYWQENGWLEKEKPF